MPIRRSSDNSVLIVLGPGDSRRVVPVTDQEFRIVRLLQAGLTLRNISETLNITFSTTRTHFKKVFAKTECHSQVELVARVVRGAMPEMPGPVAKAIPVHHLGASEAAVRGLVEDILKQRAMDDEVRNSITQLTLRLDRLRPQTFSPRQEQLLGFLCRNMSRREMAEATGLTHHAIHRGLDRLNRKLRVRTQLELVLLLVATGALVAPQTKQQSQE